MKLLCGIFLGCAIVHAGPLPACGSQFQYSCASPTLGGFTVITPLASAGSTEITGYNSSNGVVFDQTIPTPPTGPAGSDVQNAVSYADALIAEQSGLLSTLPLCAGTSSGSCLSVIGNDGYANVQGLNTFTYVASDTAVTQRVDQYSTTLIATLNGSQVFSQTLDAPFSDPSVQAALSTADGILSADGASFGAPFLASGNTSLLGSDLSYVQTGETPTGNVSFGQTVTFGPAFAIVTCFTASCNYAVVFIEPSVSDDIVTTVAEFAIDRNVVTTNTFLTTQTYEIDGTTETNAVPEPATWGLMLAGALAIAIRKIRRS